MRTLVALSLRTEEGPRNVQLRHPLRSTETRRDAHEIPMYSGTPTSPVQSALGLGPAPIQPVPGLRPAPVQPALRLGSGPNTWKYLRTAEHSPGSSWTREAKQKDLGSKRGQRPYAMHESDSRVNKTSRDSDG